MKLLRPIFLFVDLGFIVYWIVTLFSLLPAEWLYQDYMNPLLVAWNWSFLPLDLAVSATGLLALRLHTNGDPRYRSLVLASLCLTTASGFQAISFWAARCEFNLFWWLPNLFLLIYPWYFIVTMFLCEKASDPVRGKTV